MNWSKPSGRARRARPSAHAERQGDDDPGGCAISITHLAQRGAPGERPPSCASSLPAWCSSAPSAESRTTPPRAAGTLWVPRHDAFDLLGLEWKRRRERSSVNLQTPQVALGFGSVWTLGADGALRRIDPWTLRVTGTVGGVSFSSEGFEPKIAAGRDAPWISDAVRHAVTRVDPRRLRVSAVVSHGGNGLAVAGAQVWSTDGSSARRVAGGPIRRVRTGIGAYDVAAGGGAIWVANRFSRTVAKLNPERGTVVRTFRLPGRPSVLAYGAGYVAVALF
jgi:hypothetical protein